MSAEDAIWTVVFFFGTHKYNMSCSIYCYPVYKIFTSKRPGGGYYYIMSIFSTFPNKK